MPMLNLDKENEWAMSGPIWEHWPRLVLPQIAALTTDFRPSDPQVITIGGTNHPSVYGRFMAGFPHYK